MDGSEMNVTVKEDTVTHHVKQMRNDLDNLIVYPGIFLPGAGENIKVIGFPNRSRLIVYTLSGKKVHVSDMVNGGGEITWNGRCQNGRYPSADLYIYMVKDEKGNKKAGKLLIGN